MKPGIQRYLDLEKTAFFMLFFLFLNIVTEAQKPFTIMSYNVYEGFQKDSLQKEKFKTWVKQFNPDIIAFQELNGFTYTSLEELGRSYGHPYVVLQKDWGYPVGITSKYPITDIEKRSDDFTFGYINAWICDYNIFLVHLNPFQYPKRYIQINSILAQAARIPKHEKIIILGDLNSLSPNDSLMYDVPDRLKTAAGFEKKRTGAYDDNYILNNGKFDYSVIGSLINAGYSDAWLLKNKDFDHSYSTEKYSFREGAFGKKIRIDYIWLNKALRNKCIRLEIIKDEVTDSLSDHYPLILELKN
jgi:exonuclease III